MSILNKKNEQKSHFKFSFSNNNNNNNRFNPHKPIYEPYALQ